VDSFLATVKATGKQNRLNDSLIDLIDTNLDSEGYKKVDNFTKKKRANS
jgi:hypothetical protein